MGSCDELKNGEIMNNDAEECCKDTEEGTPENSQDCDGIVYGAVAFFVVFFVGLLFLSCSAIAGEQEIVHAAVISSEPYFGKHQEYIKVCQHSSFDCVFIGEEPTQYYTVFSNGTTQFAVLTDQPYPHDVWFDVERSCDGKQCDYTAATLSETQSPETMAIQEIYQNQQERFQRSGKMY